MTRNKTTLFGIKFDAIGISEAVNIILSWVLQDRGKTCHFVVTPNVDHVVRLQENPEFRNAYSNASLVLVDGKPVMWASRFLRRPLPETVPGSDLAPAIFHAAQDRNRSIRIFLLGAAGGVAERAQEYIHNKWPLINVVGTYSPPYGFERNSDEKNIIFDKIKGGMPDILIVGLGAPKQEIWVNENRAHLAAKVVLCLGATIDFLAGEKKRAPVCLRKIGLEWAYRMFREPRRLCKRYLYDAWVFPRIVCKQFVELYLKTS